MNNLQEENAQVLNLVQAMLGSITPNFRRVFLEYTSGEIQLYFILEQESAEDREEINIEIIGDFLALQDSPLDINITSYPSR